MVFDPSVYETASIATETYNPIISDEEWDSDMESDFDMLHQVHVLELMGYDVWLTRENLQEELESLFASRTCSSSDHDHPLLCAMETPTSALFLRGGVRDDGSIRPPRCGKHPRSAPRRNNLL